MRLRYGIFRDEMPLGTTRLVYARLHCSWQVFGFVVFLVLFIFSKGAANTTVCATIARVVKQEDQGIS